MSRRVYHGSGTLIGLVHVPDANVVVRPDCRRVYWRRCHTIAEIPVHRNRRAADRDFGNPNPDIRLAVFVPGIYLAGQGVGIRRRIHRHKRYVMPCRACL